MSTGDVKTPHGQWKINKEHLPRHTSSHCLVGGDAGHGDGVRWDLVREACTQRCLKT